MLRSFLKSLTAKPASTKRPARARLSVTPLEERALMTAGAFDPTFGGGDGKAEVYFDKGTPKTDHASAMAVQTDGKIVVVGWALNAAGDNDFAISRLNPDGSLDQTFAVNSPLGAGRLMVGFDYGG